MMMMMMMMMRKNRKPPRIRNKADTCTYNAQVLLQIRIMIKTYMMKKKGSENAIHQCHVIVPFFPPPPSFNF